MDQPSLETSMKRALRYLDQHRMREAARLLRRCELKLDPVADARGEVTGWEVRLRCDDGTFHQLKDWDEGTRRWRHKAPMEHVDRALKAVVTNAQAVDAEWVEDGAVALTLRIRKKPSKGKARKAPRKTAVAGPPASGDGDRMTIGRLAYEPGFNQVWVDGQAFDLTRRPKARTCLQVLVDRKAFGEQSALSFKTEIDPYVRQKCGLPAPASGAEIRIHHYFNPKDSSYDQLRRLLITHCGRNGRYYLRVR